MFVQHETFPFHLNCLCWWDQASKSILWCVYFPISPHLSPLMQDYTNESSPPSLELLGLCLWLSRDEWYWISPPNVDPILSGNNNIMAKNSKSLSNRKELFIFLQMMKKISSQSPSHIHTHMTSCKYWERKHTKGKTIIIVKIRIENRFETAGSEKRAVLCVA